MVLSETVKSIAEKEFSNLPQNIQNKIRNTTVRLDGGQFKGSAAIIEVRPATVILVTAKHNLWMYAKKNKPPAWSDYQNIASAFQKGISVLYGPNEKGSPTQSAKITTVNLPAECEDCDDSYCAYTKESWDYDVVWLAVQDDNFVNWVKANNAYFVDGTNLQKSTAPLRDYIYNPFDLTGNFSPACNRAESTLIIAGYGQTDQKNDLAKGSGLFQYRFPESLFKIPTCKLKDEDWNPMDGIILTANDNDTTAPGDSGGPLFAYNAVAKQLYLVGVTLGSNYEQDHNGKALPEEPISTNASSSLYTYFVGDIGPRTQ